MAVQKNFVIRNGIEVNNNLLIADTSTDHVGIGTSTPKNKLEVIGGIGATHINILGISTVVTEFNVGSGGTVITSLDTGLTGLGTASPAYILDIRSPVSTGQTALYVQGDVRITGDLQADDIVLDQATFNNIEVTGVGTIATSSIDLGYINTGIVTNLTTTGIASIATGVVTDAYIITGVSTNFSVSGIGSITTAVVDSGYINTGIITTLSGSNLSYSGIGSITTASIDLGYINTGIITTLSGSNLSYSGIVTAGSISIGSTQVISDQFELQNIASLDALTTATIEAAIVNAPNTFTDLVIAGIASINTGVFTSLYSPIGIITDLITSGIGTIDTVVSDVAYINTGIITNLSISGIITSGGYNVGIQSGGLDITTGVITALNFIGAGNTFSYNAGTKIVDINIGGSQWTFADQANPTTSSIYRVDGNVGIGTTNPTEKLTVIGDTLLSGDVGVNTTSIDNPNLTGVGNSFNGLYIGNGMIIVDNTLEGDHYIGTAYNGLMAGPVTINGTLTVDGNYVVV